MLRWKRAAALLLSMWMLLCLCACGSASGETSAAQSSQQSAQSGTPAPAVPEPPRQESPGAETFAPAKHGEAQTLSLQKQFYGLYDWDDDTLLVQSEFSHVTLWDEDAGKYPELAETLEQTANMVKRSMEDEYDNLCASAREELPWTGETMETAVSTLDIQVRRADNVAVSLLSDSYSDYGWIEEFRGMYGTSYDARTGEELALDDVVDVNNDLADAVADALNRHQWAGDLDYRDAVQEYFANTPYDGFRWTLDYNGVTFYFADGELEEPGNGGKTATVSFAAYPELFAEKYMAVPDAYMVELPLDSSYFTDLDGDGDLEELNVTGYFDSGVGMYTKLGIYAEADGSYHYEACFADGFLPYYVKTADGHHYLYLFCEQNEGAFPMYSLKAFDVRGGKAADIGERNAGPGYIPDGIYRVPTDPEKFYLDDFDSMAQDMMAFAVGPSGLPEQNEGGLT